MKRSPVHAGREDERDRIGRGAVLEGEQDLIAGVREVGGGVGPSASKR